MNEILSGIKIIKLYGWESKFLQNVSDVRATETSFIKKSYLINLASTFFFSSTTVLVSITTFAVYVFSSKENILTPEKAFVSISLFSILQFPINLLPMLVNFFILAHVALKRITSFLNSEELVDYVTRDYDKENAVNVEGKPIFTWELENNADDKDVKKEGDKKKQKSKKNDLEDLEKSNGHSNGHSNDIGNGIKKKEIFHLRDIEFKVKKGSFTCIIGKVGSGKTSLLCSLLGEMQLREDKMDNKLNSCKINISEDSQICYGSQQAWIQNDTLRGNILFGQEFDEFKYNEIIRACALEPDIETLPGKIFIRGNIYVNLND